MSASAGDPSELLEAARGGDERALGRLVSLAEDGGGPAARLAKLLAAAPVVQPEVLGLTGSPGVGKSTLTAALVGAYRRGGRRVAVLAVDPSSPLTGGAVLGDRIRMLEHGLDASVFIRSLSSRGHLGGLAATLPDVLDVVAVCGFDLVLVETVGAGQAEVEVARYADTTVVVLAPGFGDGIQLAKAGILEIADVLVVNKSDLDGAEQLRRGLEQMLDVAAAPASAPRPQVVAVSALRGGGLEELVDAIGERRSVLDASGELARRRAARAAARVEAIGRELVARRFSEPSTRAALEQLTARVLAGELDPYSAAELLVAG